MPKLRFPEFRGEWREIKLENNAYIKGRIGWKNLKQSEYTEEGPYLIASKHIYNGRIKWLECDHISIERYEESIEIALTDGDIIFSKDGRLGNPALIESLREKATINSTMMLIRVNKQKIVPKFFYYILNSKYFFKLINELKSGSSIPHIFQRDMNNFMFPITQIPEQEKIASFLFQVDKKIDLLETKQKLWETYKKGIIQQIFSQKIRFKDESGADYPDWIDGKLKNVLIQEIRKIKKPKTGYWRLGLRSHAKGTFHQFIDDPNKISMDYLYLVKKDDLILNITFAWEHAIALAAKDDEDKLVSHRFPTYKFFDKNNPLFYKYYVTLPKFRYELENISPGGAGRNRVLRKSDFLKICVPIPSTTEQTKIANFLSVIDSKIDNLKRELEINIEFKKGLLQQMFC
ncbi:MAG: restriction endonuclease subunit S [Methanobacterium sp.]